jgi:hypothetical protein
MDLSITFFLFSNFKHSLFFYIPVNDINTPHIITKMQQIYTVKIWSSQIIHTT